MFAEVDDACQEGGCVAGDGDAGADKGDDADWVYHCVEKDIVVSCVFSIQICNCIDNKFILITVSIIISFR